MIFHENCLPADDSHEISCLICYFWKSSKIWNCRLLQIIGGALWVNDPCILGSADSLEHLIRIIVFLVYSSKLQTLQLSLKAPWKNASENVICWSRLLQIIAKYYLRIKYKSKQRGPRTDCSYRSSLIWVHTVCHRGLFNISADEKSRQLCCDRRIKGSLWSLFSWSRLQNCKHCSYELWVCAVRSD